MKKIEDLRSLSTDKLKSRLLNLTPDFHRAEVVRKHWRAVGSDNNVKRLHNLKKERARILTILAERRLKINGC